MKPSQVFLGLNWRKVIAILRDSSDIRFSLVWVECAPWQSRTCRPWCRWRRPSWWEWWTRWAPRTCSGWSGSSESPRREGLRGSRQKERTGEWLRIYQGNVYIRSLPVADSTSSPRRAQTRQSRGCRGQKISVDGIAPGRGGSLPKFCFSW